MISLEDQIQTQFNLENIGFNYIENYEDEIPITFYSWLLEKINDMYFEIPDIEYIYEDYDKIIKVSTSLYKFLFVEILKYIELLKEYKFEKNIRDIIGDIMKNMKQLLNEQGLTSVKPKIIELSIVYDCLDNNLDDFNNYLDHLLYKFLII